MKKLIVGLTAALALGVIAAPSVTNAANEHGGGGGGHASASRGGGGGVNVARISGGNRGVASIQNRSAGVTTSARINSTRGNNGNRWAGNNRHNRNGGDYYAGYDTCWQQRLTPFGYRYINVCNDNNDIF